MIGTLLSNRYELLEKIGEGGMAEVYKAKCHKLNRFDAVKILKKEFANDEELVEKFKREATAVANLSDNNIINIFDVGSQGDINYIVMEYVKGKTLKQIIQENVRLSYERAVEIGIQIAKALDCAHRNNIIHRDVKPQNILVGDDGVVKVTDFGIAKAPTSVTITNTSKVMGSAHYFSPEQAKGSYVDCRTDIYSLGVVLYEMVTGKVPFDAESPVAVALKHIQDPAKPPIQLNSSIPEGLNNLILKAMEKDPIRRYQTVKELLIDLIRLQKDLNYEIITNNVENEFTKVMSPVNITSSSEDDDEYESSGMSSKTKKIIIFSLSAVLVIALGALMGWMATRKTTPPSPTPGPSVTATDEVKVPVVTGKTQDEAKKIIEASGLKWVLADSIPSDQPAGVVLKTFPDEGTSVKKNYEIRIRVSSGKITSKVPNLTEIDSKSAQDIIKNNGFQVGTITSEYSNTVPVDAVIRQDPPYDTAADANTKINIWVSKGPEVVYTTVPDLNGKTLTEADAILKSYKLILGKQNKVETNDPKYQNMNGKIFTQSRDKDTKVVAGTAIDVSYYSFVEAQP